MTDTKNSRCCFPASLTQPTPWLHNKTFPEIPRGCGAEISRAKTVRDPASPLGQPKDATRGVAGSTTRVARTKTVLL